MFNAVSMIDKLMSKMFEGFANINSVGALGAKQNVDYVLYITVSFCTKIMTLSNLFCIWYQNVFKC